MADTEAAAPPGYDLKVEALYAGYFDTPIVTVKVTDAAPLIADLLAVIRARKASHPGLERSNVGGWHSDAGMPQWGGAPVRALMNLALDVARRISFFGGRRMDEVRWAVQMWANVSPPGAYNTMHLHAGNIWAAVFYLDLGAGDRAPEDVGGELHFEDPRFPGIAMRSTAFRFVGPDGRPQSWHRELRPQAGDLVFFPAWLRHGVRPYRGDGERISIALNLDAVLPEGGWR